MAQAKRRKTIAAQRTRFALGRPRGELKSFDVDVSTVNVSTTAHLVCLNAMGPGTGIDERVGREITMKSIHIKGHLLASAGSVGDNVAWAVVYDRQSNGAAITWTQVYTTSQVEPNFRNLDYRKRFKVLASGNMLVDKIGADKVYTLFEVYRKLNHPVEYNAGVAETYEDIATGGLWLMMLGTYAAAGADTTLVGGSRLRYSDT